MNIECPDCSASYNIDETRIPSDGMAMRCPKCSYSFKVTAEGKVAANIGANTLLDGTGASRQRLYIKRPSGKIFGPFERSSIITMLEANKLSHEAQFSEDQSSWKAMNDFPEFARFSLDVPNFDGDPKSTQMGGGWRTNNLPTPKGKGLASGLPSPPSIPSPPTLPKPSNLPVSKRFGGDLPVKAHTGLPVPKGMAKISSLDSELPIALGANLPARLGGDLPRSLESDLPVKPLSGLPVSKATMDLPRRAHNELPVLKSGLDLPSRFEVDLPAVPGTPGRTLNSGLLPLNDDDDLFGESDDDPFAVSEPSELDMSSEVDLFSQSYGDDSEPEEENLFGVSAASDPLTSDVLDVQRNGDFLGKGKSFTFLDDEANSEEDEGWGDDLFSERSEVGQGSENISEAFDDWGEDLLSKDKRESYVSEVLDPNDPMRPRSRGLQSESIAKVDAQLTKEDAKDDDKKRGLLSIVAVGVALAILGGVGWVVYTQFFQEEVVITQSTKKEKIVKVAVALDAIKTDNYDVLAKVVNAANSGKVENKKRGELLLTQSLFLSRYKDSKTLESAKKLSLVLAKPSNDFEKLGRGAFESMQGNDAAASTYLIELTTQSGAIGFYSNIMAGIANILSAEKEMKNRPKTKSNELKNKVNKVSEGKDLAKEKSTDKKTKQKKEQKKDKKSNENKKTKTEKTEETPKEVIVKEVTMPRLSKAEKFLKAAQKIDTSSPLPNYWLGRLNEHNGKISMAIKAYGKKENATHIASLRKRSALYVKKGDLNNAIEGLEKITGELSDTASTTELASAHHLAGIVHSGRNKSEIAIENYIKALSFDPSRTDTLQKLAEEYERAKKFKEALNFFTTNKNLGKKNPDVMLGIVRSHIGLEQWIAAISQLEEGQKSFPQDARFPSMLGRLYLKRGNFFDAKKPLERAVEIDPTLLESQAMLAQLAWKMDKDIKKGEQHISKIVAYPEFISAKIAAQVAEYYRMSDRRAIAHDWFRESLKQDPNYWPARLAHARLLLEERKHKEAKTLLEKARKEGVSDIRLSAYLADAYRQENEFDHAIDEINKVIEKFPNNEEYAFILGMIEFDRGNYETARKHFNHAYEIDPKFHRAYFYVGRTLYEKGDSEGALRLFRHVLDNEPNKGEYHFFMARALEKANRMTQALDEYRKTTAIDKTYGIENPMVYVYRGRLLSQLGYAKEGRTDIARALELVPKNSEALVSMASINFDAKEYKEAIKNYQTALSSDPAQPNAQAKLGMAFLYTDKLRDAASHLQLAVKHGYKNPDVYKNLGYVYRDLGQRALASKSFKKYLEITKDQKIPAATKREILEQLRSLK